MYVPCYIHNLKTIKKKKGKGTCPQHCLAGKALEDPEAKRPSVASCPPEGPEKERAHASRRNRGALGPESS
jgi:hypothetical protein